MRFPKLTELDNDQTEIFQGAPPDGSVLIMGPPGTGKTVIGFHRAHVLKKLHKNPEVLMFNKVLARYTSSRGAIAEDVPVRTLHKWMYGWWQKVHRKTMPPTVDGNRFVHDWDLIRDSVVSASVPDRGQRFNWGHLVIDEGQDFPRAMFQALRTVMDVINLQEGIDPHLCITVLADENQRLEVSRNSSIEEIRTSLQLPPKRVYCLRKNYRNTRQIAAFAASFYVGLPAGIPDPPSKSGESPVISVANEDSVGAFYARCAEKIARYAKSRTTEEIGVLVPNNATRTTMFNRLKSRLESSNVSVQTYKSQDEVHTAEALTFDVPGHVTVLNFASAKGLEFDATFIVDPSQIIAGGSSELAAKMTLYVMSSRARSKLEVMLQKSDGASRLLSWIPHDRFRREEL
jgi:DNA helicase II / ATP-dependent DNA helicase PcrA